MSIDINIGIIGKDIVALCEDDEANYAMYAEKADDGRYNVRMSSSHGLVTEGIFTSIKGTRELFYLVMTRHLDTVRESQKILHDSANYGEIPKTEVN